MNPGPEPYNVTFGSRMRIHNVNRSSYQLWNRQTEHIFDLFDQWNENASGEWVERTEPDHIPGGGSRGPRDGSLIFKKKFF